MAKINALPSLEVINTLKHTLDFYYWKGIPCVRKWPHIPHSSRTQPSLDSAHLFGVIVQGWALVGATAKALYIQAAADQPRTGRDLYVSGVLGGQHEASMSDFLDLLTECRNYLAALQALLGPLGSVDTDDLQVDIKTALASLPVRGEDQLFTFKQSLDVIVDDDSADNTIVTLQSPQVPGNTVWIVTAIGAVDFGHAWTRADFGKRVAGVDYWLQSKLTIAEDEVAPWNGHMHLDTDDRIRVSFIGVTVNDYLRFCATGYIMTKET